MRAINELKDEHRAVRLVLEVLEKINSRLLASQQVNAGHLGKILDFFENFIDRCHHSKEELYLFPAMNEADIKKSRDQLSRILEDHGKGRVYIKGMKAALKQYVQGADRANLEFVKNGRGYIALMRKHMDREDEAVFPLAGKHLAKSKQAELAQQFGQVEIDAGPEKHEAYRQLLKKLKGMYLLN